MASPDTLITPSGMTYTQAANRLVSDARTVEVQARHWSACAKMDVPSASETPEERRDRCEKQANVYARYAGKILAMADTARSGVSPWVKPRR
jgi:hypothetical protein